MDVLSEVFDDKTVRILDNILKKEGTFYLRELSKETGVSLATTFRIIQNLLEKGLVEKEAQGKFNFYKINKKSALFEELRTLILGKKASPLDIIKRELPDNMIFHKNQKEFFIVSNKDINTKELASHVKKELGIVVKINILRDENLSGQ